ncbi:AAA family ATPase [Heliobacterium gestii]|uniref:AAA family ATPase n=1 Tax=Heliomicrobium gestii TaxID=2699 RepID=A0A845LFQ1_HELGE|nr:AAA family ATPase [Heliomicrobium gestii]MBM7867158.1 AAA15 family ATPase/GTPase [Heliomicrobium gestii]MZP43429.1 AAA family ATPase [Heliomicrobium gestii]
MSTFTRFQAENFSAFENIDLLFSPGINVFIGKNGTGKTHIMKTLYAAGAITGKLESYIDKMIRIFLPYEYRIGRLVRRKKGSTTAKIIVSCEKEELNLTFTNHSKNTPIDSNEDKWKKSKIKCAYIPVKEMLANAPGFRSLYSERLVHFEEVYSDIIDRAYLPPKRGPLDEHRANLLRKLEYVLDGKVVTEGETFFLKNTQGMLEFTLLAEGLRKLALLWLLIQNETLLKGSVLFWDEPEANLNPQMVRVVVEILLELQRFGVQVFIATHDYVTLKEIDLQRTGGDKILFHSFFRKGDGESVNISTSSDYGHIDENAIMDKYLDLYDREVEKTLGGKRD